MEGHVVKVISLAQLSYADKQRVYKEVNGRTITILSHQGQVYAFDAACFHMGGPLGKAGDIEELADHLVISCPWHHRKVDLATGKQIDFDLRGQLCPSSQAVQRVYPTQTDGNGWVWVDLSKAKEGYVPSDKYNIGSKDSSFGYGLGDLAGREFQTNGCIPPLTPYAGINRMAMSPSPIKTPDVHEQLPYRAQKSLSLRNANARMAVLQKMQQASTGVAQPQTGQQTLAQSYQRHSMLNSGLTNS